MSEKSRAFQIHPWSFGHFKGPTKKILAVNNSNLIYSGPILSNTREYRVNTELYFGIQRCILSTTKQIKSISDQL